MGRYPTEKLMSYKILSVKSISLNVSEPSFSAINSFHYDFCRNLFLCFTKGNHIIITLGDNVIIMLDDIIIILGDDVIITMK